MSNVDVARCCPGAISSFDKKVRLSVLVVPEKVLESS